MNSPEFYKINFQQHYVSAAIFDVQQMIAEGIGEAAALLLMTQQYGSDQLRAQLHNMLPGNVDRNAPSVVGYVMRFDKAMQRKWAKSVCAIVGAEFDKAAYKDEFIATCETILRSMLDAYGLEVAATSAKFQDFDDKTATAIQVTGFTPSVRLAASLHAQLIDKFLQSVNNLPHSIPEEGTPTSEDVDSPSVDATPIVEAMTTFEEVAAALLQHQDTFPEDTVTLLKRMQTLTKEDVGTYNASTELDEVIYFLARHAEKSCAPAVQPLVRQLKKLMKIANK